MGWSPAGRGPPSPALPCTGPPGAEQVSPPLLHAVAWARGASPRLTPERLRKRSGVGGFGRGAGLGGVGRVPRQVAQLPQYGLSAAAPSGGSL